MLNRLLRCSPIQVWLISIAGSVILTEAINAAMELLLTGSVTFYAQLIGLVASLMVSAIIASIVISMASARFRLQSEITANACEGVVLTSIPDGIIIYTNPHFDELFGYNKGELIGRHISLINAPTDMTPRALADHIEQALENKGRVSGEVLNVKKDGTTIWTSSHVSVFFDKKYGSVSVTHQSDISERKRMVAALSTNEKRLNAILKSASDGIHIVDTEGTLVEGNDAFLHSIGYNGGWIGRLKVWDWDISVTHESVLKSIAKLIDSDDGMQVETRFRHRDGHEFWVNLSIHAFRIEGKDFIYCSSHDITARKHAQDRLIESEQRFRNIANASPVMIWVAGPDKLCEWFSQGWLNFTGRTLNQEHGNGWADGVHPDDLQRCTEHYVKHFDLRQPFSMEYRLKHRSGEYHWISDDGAPRFDDAGEFLGYIGSCVDINIQKKTEETLRLSASVFEHAQESIVVTDADRRIISVNNSFTRITGFSREEVLGRNPRILQSGRQHDDFYRVMWQSLAESGNWSGEMWNCTKSGELYAQLLSITVIKNEHGQVAHYVGVSTNITPLKEYQRELENHAQYDHLTGLPNRVLLQDRKQQALAQARRNNELLVVCYLDLDGFKPINDSAGHAIGDLVLIEIAKRISNTLRSVDTVARVGGDEFIILLTGLTKLEETTVMLDRLLAEMRRPINIDDMKFSVSASVGVSIFPNNAEEPDTLVEQADQAMYAAKRLGGNRYQLYYQHSSNHSTTQ